MPTPVYSTLFSCLYDESDPIGNLGRGCHYSVFRSVEWLDVTRKPLEKPQIHDFAVIWDEDHDTRIIEVIESIYMAGLLSPVQFIGERKGELTVIVAAKFYFDGDSSEIEAYTQKLNEISMNPKHGDCWPTKVGMFDRTSSGPFPHQTELHGIIAATEHRALVYLQNIDSLWALGTKNFVSMSRGPALIPLPPTF